MVNAEFCKVFWGITLSMIALLALSIGYLSVLKNCNPLNVICGRCDEKQDLPSSLIEIASANSYVVNGSEPTELYALKMFDATNKTKCKEVKMFSGVHNNLIFSCNENGTILATGCKSLFYTKCFKKINIYFKLKIEVGKDEEKARNLNGLYACDPLPEEDVAIRRLGPSLKGKDMYVQLISYRKIDEVAQEPHELHALNENDTVVDNYPSECTTGVQWKGKKNNLFFDCDDEKRIFVTGCWSKSLLCNWSKDSQLTMLTEKLYVGKDMEKVQEIQGYYSCRLLPNGTVPLRRIADVVPTEIETEEKTPEMTTPVPDREAPAEILNMNSKNKTDLDRKCTFDEVTKLYFKSGDNNLLFHCDMNNTIYVIGCLTPWDTVESETHLTSRIPVGHDITQVLKTNGQYACVKSQNGSTILRRVGPFWTNFTGTLDASAGEEPTELYKIRTTKSSTEQCYKGRDADAQNNLKLGCSNTKEVLVVGCYKLKNTTVIRLLTHRLAVGFNHAKVANITGNYTCARVGDPETTVLRKPDH